MNQTLPQFLDKTNLEDRILESAAKGDDNNTAHGLRMYKDIVKMYRDGPLKTYNEYKDMYISFKTEIEGIIGEKLYL